MNRTRPARDARAGFLKFLAIGCLGIILLMVIGAVMAWRNRYTIMAGGVESVMTTMIEASEFPSDQKDKILAQVRSLAQDIRDRKLTMKDFERIAKEFAEGPLIPLGMLAAAREQFFKGSQLDEAARADADLAFQRFTRGVVEQKIKMDQMKRVMEIIVVEKPGNKHELRDLSEADKQKLLDTVKEIADAAAMPDEPFELDYAKEFKRIMDRARGRETLDHVEDFDGGTTPTMNSERPESVESEIPALANPKEFPESAPEER